MGMWKNMIFIIFKIYLYIMRNDYFLYGFYIVLWDENVYYYMGCNFI